MFLGGALVAGALAAALTAAGRLDAPPRPDAATLAWVVGLALVFLIGNLALQYGATRLPANVTAVIMLVEVVFASGSALALGGGSLTVPAAVGGSMIVAAALLAGAERPPLPSASSRSVARGARSALDRPPD
jgi:drug/metabolite transporter (DMT)-like permease